MRRRQAECCEHTGQVRGRDYPNEAIHDPRERRVNERFGLNRAHSKRRFEIEEKPVIVLIRLDDLDSS